MPSWELAIWAAELSQYEAQDTLTLLDVATFADWVGEMPKRPAKDDFDRKVQRAHEEGNQARRTYREALRRKAYGLSLMADDPTGRINEHGEFVDAQGRIHARNAAHIHQILSRPRA